jgi:uncharacterized protein (TIGR03085 family)
VRVPAKAPPQRLERQALCDLFVERGADAPTLCAGWAASDLAAHLFVREHRPIASIGLVAGGTFKKRLERVMKDVQARYGFETLVSKVREGPPFLWTPIDHVANLNEYFVHHEDLRRGAGDNTPRPASEIGPVEDALWTSFRRLARMSARSLRPIGLDLVRDDGEVLHVLSGEPVATLTGRPGEIALYLSGRKDAADVAAGGPDDAAEALKRASFGI